MENIKNIQIDSSQTAMSIHMKELTRYQLLSPEEEKSLFEEYEKTKDPEIKERIINGNCRLVVSIAKQYINRGIELIDLISLGYLGLIKSIDKFDVSLGNKFSTYATWWIQQSITRGLADEGALIRKPVHIHEDINTVKKAENKLRNDLGRDPTPDEVAEYLDGELNADDIDSLKQAFVDVASLDCAICSDSDSTLLDFVADPNDEIHQFLDEVENKELVEKLLDKLNDRETIVMKMRYGIGDNVPHTLEEVGEILGVTRERIRQIEAKCLRKLALYAKKLHDN